MMVPSGHLNCHVLRMQVIRDLTGVGNGEVAREMLYQPPQWSTHRKSVTEMPTKCLPRAKAGVGIRDFSSL